MAVLNIPVFKLRQLEQLANILPLSTSSRMIDVEEDMCHYLRMSV